MVKTFKNSTAERVLSDCSQLRCTCNILEYLLKSTAKRVQLGSIYLRGRVFNRNVAHSEGTLYRAWARFDCSFLTRGDNVTPLYVSWEQYSSGECRTHSWTRGSSVAFGSLRPFGPVSGSNVARGSSVLYLTRGDNVTPLYVSWEQ